MPESEQLTYNPSVKVYYGEDRLVPAPNISINHELIYANDIVIGYTPVLTLTGYATSIDRRNLIENKVYGFSDTLDAIERIKNTFKSNGKVLIVTDTDSVENYVLKAIGSTIRSLSINESDNLWNNYAPYTIEIEFNEIWFGGCSNISSNKSCGDIYDGLTDSPELLDMKKYRVKSVNDSFTISLNDQEANDTQISITCNDDAKANNPAFDITYRISAVGKHYFDDDGQLIPAWEQAKRFVQYKINEQMKNRLRSGTFMERTADTSPKTLSELYSEAAAGLGIIGDINFDSEFKIFNETIQCEASEAEGSFSATYSAKCKKADDGDPESVQHSFSKNISMTDDGSKRNISITIDGTIQGLVETGLTASDSPITLIDNGSMFLFNDSPGKSSAYDNALSAFNDYIGTDGGLSCEFIQCLEINAEALGLVTDDFDECPIPECIEPQSYSVTHDYTGGSISYSATFTTQSVCDNAGGDYSNITITVEDSVDIIAEFIIPGRSQGPIIQKIGAKTPRKTTVNIEGASSAISTCCATSIGGGGCELSVPGAPPEQIGTLKLLDNNITVNPIDGTYSISRTYICCE